MLKARCSRGAEREAGPKKFDANLDARADLIPPNDRTEQAASTSASDIIFAAISARELQL